MTPEASFAESCATSPINEVRAIYRGSYVDGYSELYLVPWRRKHELNVINLNRIFLGLPSFPRWLDLACGQAWHFSIFPGRARMMGIDISLEQLLRARANAPHADFICSDITNCLFAPRSFDLVTNFWAGYCYLRSRARIQKMVHRAVESISAGGALYLEVLLGRDLKYFNESKYAQCTGFYVTPLSPDFSEWEYIDNGGRHVMTSPPLDDFLEIVKDSFASVEVRHDGSFMHHLTARGRQ